MAGARLAYVDELRPRFQAAFDAISRSGLAVDLVYRTEPERTPEAYLRRLAQSRAIDRARGY